MFEHRNSRLGLLFFECQEIGIDGLIIPDLPVDVYHEEYKAIFERYGLINVFLITPQTSEERIKFIDSVSNGFIYMVSSASVTGLAAEYNGTSQLFGTNSANIVLSTSKNEILGFATYPNPITNKRFTISSSNAEVKEISVFNVLGKKVFSTSFTGLKKDIDVSAITSGVYILKVTEAGKTATKKLVVR